MRRLGVAGAAIVLCLSLGAPVAGQESSPGASPAAMTPAVFTGTNSCGIGTGKWLADDPRVTGSCSGVSTNARLVDRYPGPLVGVGDYGVNGPDGDWIGTWAVMAGDDLRTVFRGFIVLEGTEAYEGWAVWAWTSAPEGWQEGTPGDLEGVIYEGTAPRLEWVEE
jgi:hypothetical protein